MASIGTADPMENILLIRLKSIGDVLFTLPAVHAVRENFPEARLHFLVSHENAPLLRGFSDIDEVIPLDRAVYFSTNLKAMCAGTFQLLRWLRRQHFSRVIDFQGYGETELLAWWTGAPLRWGSVYNRSRGWLYTRGVWRNDRLHLADWNLSLLQQCGLRIGPLRNEFMLPGDALADAKHFFAANNLDTAKSTLYLQPLTSSPQKNWPLEKYLALARFWRERGIQIIFSGGPGDRSRLEQAQAKGFVVAAGIPRLTDAGLMKLSTLIVGGDTGFLHLAVALGKRVLMLIKRVGPGAPVPFRHPDWIVEPRAALTVEHVELQQVLQASVAAFDECGVTKRLSNA